jgi:transcriptional repressor NrdR
LSTDLEKKYILKSAGIPQYIAYNNIGYTTCGWEERSELRCPFCDYHDSKVIDSRAAEEGNSIRRRRECLQCARRFTTYEMVEDLPLRVIKKDGRRMAFDRSKILNGLMKACEKRPISLKTLEETTDKVEKELRNSMEREIPSRVIGEVLMKYLRELDHVAYVRFASVYREFTDIDNFMDELESLKETKEPQLMGQEGEE